MCVFVVVVVGLLVGFVVVLWIFFEYTGFHCLVKTACSYCDKE